MREVIKEKWWLTKDYSDILIYLTNVIWYDFMKDLYEQYLFLHPMMLKYAKYKKHDFFFSVLFLSVWGQEHPA